MISLSITKGIAILKIFYNTRKVKKSRRRHFLSTNGPPQHVGILSVKHLVKLAFSRILLWVMFFIRAPLRKGALRAEVAQSERRKSRRPSFLTFLVCYRFLKIEISLAVG